MGQISDVDDLDLIINSPLLRAWRGIHRLTKVPNIRVVFIVKADVLFCLDDCGCRSPLFGFIYAVEMIVGSSKQQEHRKTNYR